MTRSDTARALILLLAAAPLVVTASACSSPSAPAPAPVPAAARPGALDLPAETRALLADAERALVRDCMARQGFSFFYDSTDLAELRAEAAATNRELTLDDVPRARREGFGPAPGAPARSSSPAERQEQAYLAGLSPQRRNAWEKALMGQPGQRRIKVSVPGVGTMEHPTAGCFAEARIRLFGDYERWARADTFVNARFRPVDEEVKKSPDYKEATARWSTCVGARGHHFTTPDNARARASTLQRDQAISLAVATAECDRQVGRSKTHRSLYEQATRHWAERHPTEAADFRRLNAEAAARLTAATTAPGHVPDPAMTPAPGS
ncbi:hypothetical protein ACIGPN_29480 [Streptomyces afghaniensis]|uniref:hypothetical protein n=1 Tax=Streptomyces TaxID=1883 RepID=UPI001FAFB377|nr:hypothetical protein [Streptomyces sp. HP-A2021]UOB15307.1 hypothetical protein MQE23_42445 [Streptomyces sp. HP-A2021]